MNHEELKAIALNRGDVKAEYDALEAEFALLHQMLAAQPTQHVRKDERSDYRLLDCDMVNLSKWDEEKWEGDEM